jgi:NADPH:quinone reductase-like Zn-dependent oxidoreductase
MMINMGILVESWPFVPGCDAAGIVVKVGEQAASKFKVGDEVCGCTRLGSKGYSTCQEFVGSFSYVPRPSNLTCLYIVPDGRRFDFPQAPESNPYPGSHHWSWYRGKS